MLFQNKSIKVENVRSFFESTFIQKYLVRDGWKLIYVDEFHLSPKTSAIYSWSKKNTPACIAMNSGSLILSFIVALSEQAIEGIMAVEKSIEGKTFYWFISDVWRKMWEKNGNDKVCMIMDNAALHKSKAVVEGIQRDGIRWVTITPYSPQLNAAEKIIAVLKYKMKKVIVSGRSLSLSRIKEIIDTVSSRTWRRWVEESQLDVYHKLQHIKSSFQ